MYYSNMLYFIKYRVRARRIDTMCVLRMCVNGDVVIGGDISGGKRTSPSTSNTHIRTRLIVAIP